MDCYIFLDIDGVLNSLSGFIKRKGAESYDLYSENMEVLLRLITTLEDKSLNIVISSTWRLPYLKDNDLRGMKNVFSDYPEISSKIIGMTPSLRCDNCQRGNEIVAWLQENSINHTDPQIQKNLAVIDDDDDMNGVRDFFFRTNPDEGLTYSNMLQILKHFIGGDNVQAFSLICGERRR